jgi:hypothetical protein
MNDEQTTPQAPALPDLLDFDVRAELRKLCMAATPGPWTAHTRTKDSGPIAGSVTVWVDGNDDEEVLAGWVHGTRDHAKSDRWMNNAAFIVAARAHMVRLIDLVDYLLEQQKDAEFSTAPQDTGDSLALTFAHQRVLEQAADLARKFVEKVESGRARSRETYAECKALLAAIPEVYGGDAEMFAPG